MSDLSGPTAVVVDVVGAVELLLCTGVCVVLGRRWRHERSGATARAFGIFFVLALVIAVGYVAPSDTQSGWGAWFTDVLISVLVLMPYLLVELTWVLGGVGERVRRAAQVLLAVQVVATFATPPLPAPGEASTASSNTLVALIVVSWTVQSFVAGRGLWRLGRGQSSLVQHRMRALSTGSVLLALTLVLSGAAGTSQDATTRVVVSLLGLLAVAVSALSFLAPTFLRLIWRQGDVAALSDAERGLMQATSTEQVARIILPALVGAFGGSGAAVLGPHGERRFSEGTVPPIPEAWLAGRSGDGVLVAPMRVGALAVGCGALSPVFGHDEAELLGRVAVLVDLAWDRVELFEQERRGRLAVEAANEELETLLYSVSHDLRSPLISVLGYLDFLKQEHGHELTGDGSHYLDRISVNAVYMQSLISDLLELSRIGRLDPPAEGAQDLAVIATEVLDGAQLGHPDATLHVRGELPHLAVSDVRLRQLLTNLVDNALRHGGRDDLTVTISAERSSTGVRVLVSDNGRGIPAEYRARVVKVFERLDAPKSSPGTGIGLAICKRIAETLGGTLTVLGPTEPDVTGTTIEISLPVALVATGRRTPVIPPQLQEEIA